MVGPRSTGCKVCVDRRVRCDGAKPKCQRCIRAGFDCTGYQRSLQWLPPKTTEGVNTLSTAKHGTRNQQQDSRKVIASVAQPRMPKLDSTSAMIVSPTAYSEDVYCIFFLDKYFSFGNWNSDLQQNRSWIFDALQQPSKYAVTNPACRSLVTAFYANTHRSDSLKAAALDIHTSALRSLRHSILDESVSFDTLGAVALLGIYEACVCTTGQSWQKHAKAMKTLFEKLGADHFRQGPRKSLLTLCRHQLINEAILFRSKCFLEEPEWHNILDSNDNESNLTIKLGDTVLFGPGILADITTLEKSQWRTSEDAELLFSRLMQHLEDLNNWWVEWSSDESRLPARLASQGLADTLIDPPLMPKHLPSNILYFRNLEAAAGFCRYHAHVILALHWTNRLLAMNIPGTVSEKSMPTFVQIREDGRQRCIPVSDFIPHVLAICEALPYYSLPQYRSQGATYIGLPARVAWQALPAGTPESLFIEELMDLMADQSGFAVTKYTLKDLETGG